MKQRIKQQNVIEINKKHVRLKSYNIDVHVSNMGSANFE